MTRGAAVALWLGGVLVAAAFAVWAAVPPSAKPFYDKVAELRAAGYATTWDEHVGPPLPDETNGAPQIVAAWTDFVAAEGDPATWTVTGPWDATARTPWPEAESPERLAALADALDRWAPFLDRIEAASRKPRIRFPPARDATGLPDFPSIRTIQNVQRLLEAAARVHRDPARRLAAVATSLRIGARMDATSAMELMVAAATVSQGRRAMQSLVERGEVSATDARSACDETLRVALLDGLPRTARGEIAFVAELSDAALRGAWTAPRAAPAGGTGLMARVFGSRGDEPTPAEVAALLERYRAAAEMPTDDAAALHEALAVVGVRTGGGARLDQWLPQVTSRVARVQSANALARVALAAAVFRDREGRWPATSAELDPDFPGGVPVDPCDGLPFDLVEDGDGVLHLSGRGRFATQPPATPEERREEGLEWRLPPR